MQFCRLLKKVQMQCIPATSRRLLIQGGFSLIQYKFMIKVFNQKGFYGFTGLLCAISHRPAKYNFFLLNKYFGNVILMHH